jgi:hypothetical protein
MLHRLLLQAVRGNCITVVVVTYRSFGVALGARGAFGHLGAGSAAAAWAGDAGGGGATSVFAGSEVVYFLSVTRW